MPRPYLPRAQRRAQILDATEALMVELGVQAVTMARIADAVGLTPGALYRHFRSRGEIVAAIVERDRDELAAVEARDLGRYLAAEAERYLTDPDYARVRRELVYLASLDADFAARALSYERDLVVRVGAEHAVAMRAAQLVLDGLSLRVARTGGFDPDTDAAVRRLFRLLGDTAGSPSTEAPRPATERARPAEAGRPSNDPKEHP